MDKSKSQFFERNDKIDKCFYNQGKGKNQMNAMYNSMANTLKSRRNE